MKNNSDQDMCNLVEICELWALGSTIEMRLIKIHDCSSVKVLILISLLIVNIFLTFQFSGTNDFFPI